MKNLNRAIRMKKFITTAVSAVFVMATGVSAVLNAAINPSEEEKAGAAVYIDPAPLTPAQATIDTTAVSRQKSVFTPEKGLTGEYNYIVRFSEPPLATYRGGIAGLAATSPEIDKDVRGSQQKRPSKLNAQSANSRAYLAYLGQRHVEREQQIGKKLNRAPRVIHRYKAALNAITIRMTQDEAIKLVGMEGITHIERDFLAQPDTDRGPTFIGAEPVWDGSGTGVPAAQGEGVIVGIIDSGINGQHPSFADIGGDGYDHTNPNGPGTYFGECFRTPDLVCNDKLIGRYNFTDAQPGAAVSSEDVDGHGSHVASTAAGNVLNAVPVVNAEGNASGVTNIGRMSGVAPHANIIAYRVCAPNCAISDSIKAIDQAILDGVDVLNESISNQPGSPWNSSKALAFLNARAAGISVAISAGNSGPGFGTAATAVNAPWNAGVAALSHDRAIPAKTLTDFSGGSTSLATLEGRAVTSGYGPANIVYAGNFSNGDFNPAQCLTAFPAGTWTNGEIVVCDRGTIARTQKCINVRNGGAAGCVLANITGGASDIADDAHVIPAIHISAAHGNALKTWLASGSGHRATITESGAWSIDPARGDIMAAFSSRGPYTGFDFLAPNVAAPGFAVYAASRSPEQYAFLQGTSMASPHVAGAMALIRQVTTWSDAEILSALMSTGQRTVLKQDGVTPANSFDYGAGRIRVNLAAIAGLILDESAANFQAADPALGGDPKTLNVASMVNRDCRGKCSWQRTVKATTSATWIAGSSGDMGISVEPASFTLAAGESQTITVTADVSALGLFDWYFAALTLTPDVSEVPVTTMPVVVNAGLLLRTLSLTTTGNGSGTVSGDGSYRDGDTATVSASANVGSTFTGWSGPDAAECDTSSVLMDADKSCTATFTLNTHTLSVNTAGNGSGTVTGAGSYDYGDTATVTAIANTGSTFTGWSGADAAECGTGSVAITADKSCTATFTLDTHSLSVSTAGNGGGTVTGAGSYNYGDTATVTAIANTGSTFTGWSGADAAECGTGSVAITTDKNCTATFTLNTHTLSVNTAGNGGGTVTGAGSYNYGDTATVTAIANTGSTFIGWSGTDAAQCGTGSVAITADKSCTATFTLNTHSLSVSTAGTGSGTVTGAGTYYYGSSVSITAVAGANSTFAGWSGANAAECDTGSVTITADKDCTATFKATLTVTAQDQSKHYLDPNPVLSYDITGFQQGESASAVSGTPTCTTTALQSSLIGSYPITCTLGALSTSDYTFVFEPGTLTILPRDALVNYIGQTTWTTSGTRSTTAQVTLTASVQDPTTTGLVNAKMNFKDLNTGKYLATGVVVAPVANSPGTGTANTVVTLSSGQYGAESYMILVEMTGDYTNADQSAHDKTAVIAVAKPSTSNTTIGIGSMVSLPAAAGTYQGNGGDIGYTIGMKYNKSGANLQGRITVSVPQDDGVLWIKSNSISSMTVVKSSSPKTSTIYTKSTVYKVTPSGVQTIDGNVTLRIDSEDGAPDKVGVTVLSSRDSTLYYSNQWLLVPGSNGGQSVWKTVPQAVKVALPTTNSMVTIK
jgi:subtilisin family serine protease